MTTISKQRSGVRRDRHRATLLGSAVLSVSCAGIFGLEPPEDGNGGANGAERGGSEANGGNTNDAVQGGKGAYGGGATDTGRGGSGAHDGGAAGGARTPYGGSATSGGSTSAGAGQGAASATDAGSGAAAGTTTSLGGSAGTAGTPAVAGAGGDSAGRADSDGGTSGTDGGTDGATPPPPSTPFPNPGDPCKTPGTFACLKPKSVERLLCLDGTWQHPDLADLTIDCMPAQRCDRRSGLCAPPFEFRQTRDAACDSLNQGLLKCGPDGVSIESVSCPLGCDRDHCRWATDEHYVIDEAPQRSGLGFWPNGPIRTCVVGFSDLEPDALERVRWIEDEVARSWGRSGGVYFTGFGECEGPSDVVLSLEPGCSQYLASFSALGFPHPGQQTRISICTSYLPPLASEVVASEALVRHVAAHVFGHVLGADDVVWDQTLSSELMTNVVDLSRDPLFPAFRENEEEWLWMNYGRRPRRSLVTGRGDCVTASASGLLSTDCSGEADQSWLFDGQSVSSSGGCLSSENDGVSLEPCAAVASEGARFGLERVYLRAPTRSGIGLCVVVVPGQSPSLAAAPCETAKSDGQTFAAEFVDSEHLRLHSARGGCIAIPRELVGSPTLDDCSTDESLLEVTEDGELARGSYCLTAGSTFMVYTCRGQVDQIFSLSGPLQRGNQALAVNASGGSPEFTLAPLGPEPAPEQMFEYRF